VDLNPLLPGLSGGSPTTLIIIPWNASHLLFLGFYNFPNPTHGFSPLAFQSMFMCVCVVCKRSWVGGLVTPPPLGWVCHHILKRLVKYLCVWVCPWWLAEIDHFFRWLFGHKTWPNYLIIFIWLKGWWLVSISSSKKDKFKRTKAKTQITKLIPI